MGETDSWEKNLQETVLRESILNWYEFHRDADLLEICSGPSVLTELFRRRVRSVTTVVLQEKEPEASGDSDRLHRLEEAEDRRYDYIVCLEQAEREPDPVSFVGRLKRLLRPGGILLLGADNRYGLKYFCGCGEKYSGIPYLGINGYPGEFPGSAGKGRLWSRSEWQAILQKAGFEKSRFFYPVPDSRMPQMIYTDEYTDATNAAERLVDYDYEDPGMAVIEHRIFRDVIASGSLSFMTNSFLMEITADGNLSDIDYVVVTTDRGPERGMATTIRNNGQVMKRPLWEQGEAHLRALAGYTEELASSGVPVIPVELQEDPAGIFLRMPCVPYESLSPVLTRLAGSDRARFEKIFDRIYECIRLSFRPSGPESGRVYLDLAPCNCFLVPGSGEGEESLLFYDQEFVTENGTPGFAMFRTLKYFFASSPQAAKSVSLSDMYLRYGITPEQQKDYETQEEAFIRSVRHSDRFRWVFSAAVPDYRQLYERACRMKAEKRKPYRIGYVPGVFDLFHTGHLRLIERCKERCDHLIVGVLTDELVEFYKGKPPVVSCEDRMNVIRGLKACDEVIPVDFSNTDKLDAWEQLHYDCHFSGDDHVGHWNDVWQELKKRGSNMEFFSYTKGISSTAIKEKAGLNRQQE